ncbi:MAG TPA: hypothetical protein VKE98_12960, partial [Gemmataceae bacterium]|nr:hypothetical protein [Gemmataceae bacterium]
MKRKLKWTAAVLAVLLLGFGTAIFLWPRDRITVETYKKLRIGITEGEVEGLLGGPGISEDVFMAQLNVLEKQVGKFPYVEDGTHFAEPECFDCPP